MQFSKWVADLTDIKLIKEQQFRVCCNEKINILFFEGNNVSIQPNDICLQNVSNIKTYTNHILIFILIYHGIIHSNIYLFITNILDELHINSILDFKLENVFYRF